MTCPIPGMEVTTSAFRDNAPSAAKSRAVFHQRIPGGCQFVKSRSRPRGRFDPPQPERRAHFAYHPRINRMFFR